MDGRLLRTIGEPGALESTGEAGLNAPSGLLVDSQGHLHVADAQDGRIEVFTRTGEFLREYGSHGTAPGEMLAPRSLAQLPNGLVYVTDPTGGFVHVFGEDGSFVERFRPCDEKGRPVIPRRVSADFDGELYVWSDGQLQAP